MFYPPSEFVVKRDPAYGDQVAERQFTGITGLLKDDGLIFIKEFICDNKVSRPSLTPILWSLMDIS